MRFGPSQPFQPWECDHGKCFYGGGDTGMIGAAGIYAASSAANWVQALLVPGVQAAANILLMEQQRSDYDDIVSDQRQLLGIAVTNYMTSINTLLSGSDFEDAFPDVPQAAEYVPIDACCIQRATIECNIATTDRAGVWAAGVNRLKEQDAIIRGIVFDPRFLVNMDMISFEITDMIRGKLPTGDVVEVLTDLAEMNALNGRIGNSRRRTARDLGISKLRMQAAGRREFREHHQFISQSIQPISDRAKIEDMMQTPQQRIALALTQAQLIQQSLQNLYNRNAQKDPYKLAELQMKMQQLTLKLQFEANKASLVNTFVPNYQALLAPLIKSVAGAIGDPVNTVSTPAVRDVIPAWDSPVIHGIK